MRNEKYKAIAIPVSLVDDKPKFLTVRTEDIRIGYLSLVGVDDVKYLIHSDVLSESLKKKLGESFPSNTVNTPNSNLQLRRALWWTSNTMCTSFCRLHQTGPAEPHKTFL